MILPTAWKNSKARIFFVKRGDLRLAHWVDLSGRSIELEIVTERTKCVITRPLWTTERAGNSSSETCYLIQTLLMTMYWAIGAILSECIAGFSSGNCKISVFHCKRYKLWCKIQRSEMLARLSMLSTGNSYIVILKMSRTLGSASFV